MNAIFYTYVKFFAGHNLRFRFLAAFKIGTLAELDRRILAPTQ